jgi:hypothetical protein
MRCPPGFTAEIDIFNKPGQTVADFVSAMQVYMPLPEFIVESVDRHACLHGMLLFHVARWFLHALFNPETSISI